MTKPHITGVCLTWLTVFLCQAAPLPQYKHEIQVTSVDVVSPVSFEPKLDKAPAEKIQAIKNIRFRFPIKIGNFYPNEERFQIKQKFCRMIRTQFSTDPLAVHWIYYSYRLVWSVGHSVETSFATDGGKIEPSSVGCPTTSPSE